MPPRRDSAPLQCALRSLPTLAGNPQPFALSLPFVTTSTFTNNYKNRVAYAIATALTRYGVPTLPDAVLLLSVRDNAFAFTPNPGGTRSGVTITFAIDVRDPAYAANVSFQLNSNRPNTVGRDASLLMSAMGIVPVLFQRDVVFREIFPPIPPRQLTGAETFGVLLLVAVLVVLLSLFVHYIFLKPRGIHVPLIPSPAFFHGLFCGCASRRAE